jgi:hypothetical protein
MQDCDDVDGNFLSTKAYPPQRKPVAAAGHCSGGRQLVAKRPATAVGGDHMTVDEACPVDWFSLSETSSTLPDIRLPPYYGAVVARNIGGRNSSELARNLQPLSPDVPGLDVTLGEARPSCASRAFPQSFLPFTVTVHSSTGLASSLFIGTERPGL